MAAIDEAGAALHRELGTLSLREVVRVPAGASLRETASRLREADVSSALVGDSSRDIVTERDLTRAFAEGRGPDDPVEAIEERTPLWATTTSYVIDAAWMMLHHEIRHLIVLGIDGKAVGVVSMRDIFSMLIPAMPGGSPTGANT
jgi:signal-transduction protein with cAMP-binding, CBS, and nucleotidyltransferase domain